MIFVLHVDLFGGAVHSPYLHSMVRSLPDFDFHVLTGRPVQETAVGMWPENVRFVWRKGTWLDMVSGRMPRGLARLWGAGVELLRGVQNRQLVRRSKFDLLHIQAAVEVEAFLRLGARLRMRSFWVIARWLSDFRWTRRPVLFTEHSQFSRRGELGFPNPLHEGDLVVASVFPNVVCVDRDSFGYLAAHDKILGVSRRRWFVPNGIDTRVFSPRPLEDRSTLRIGYAGRLFRTGESRTFLPRVVESLPAGAELHLAVASSLSEEAIRDRWFPNDHVHIRRNVSNSEMPSFYWSIDLLVNPLVWGGVGRSSLEAMSCGRAVAMFANADRYPVTEENGYLLPLDQVDAFTSLATRLRHHRDELLRKGQLARQRIEEEFDERSVAHAMRGVYEELLARPGRESGTGGR